MNTLTQDTVEQIDKNDTIPNGAVKQSPKCTDEFNGSLNIADLFKKHNESLLRFLIAKLGSEQEAQDVAQEAYVRMLGLDNDKIISHMQAYLFRTANNLAIDRLRQRKRHAQTLSDLYDKNSIFESTQTIENSADAKQRLKLIQDILGELPPKCRMAFLLYKFKCMSYEEIANDMKLTESMIRKYILRAVRYCQERLEQLA